MHGFGSFENALANEKRKCESISGVLLPVCIEAGPGTLASVLKTLLLRLLVLNRLCPL